MPTRRPRRPRPRSRFSVRDYAELEALFAGKPDAVLSWFETLGISCLAELDMYRRLTKERPSVAARIAFVAATMGIPITDGNSDRSNGEKAKYGSHNGS